MSGAEPGAEFITIARIVKPQGRKGEVAAELHTDFPERFAERGRLQLLLPSGSRRVAELEAHWLHRGRVILKFRGVESIAAAQELKGAEVQILRAQRAPLVSGAYISDLVGCVVSANGTLVGPVTGVQFGAGEAPLLAVAGAGGEVLIPFAEAYIVRLDLARRKLEMDLPEGMLALDAPLSEDEKRAQRKR